MNDLEILKKYEDVNNYFEQLEEEKCFEIAIDIECEMNLHCYGEHLCLVQIFDNKRKILIDPLAFESKEELTAALKLVFENRKLLKITYDSQSDAMLIEKLYGIKFKTIYDLRHAVTLLEYEKQSLSYILNEELEIPLISKKKFQTYNWMRRPIEKNALDYAMSDVFYLLKLKEILIQKIVEKKLLDKYMLLNLMSQNKELEFNDPEDIYKKRKGYNKLSRKSKDIFKIIYDLREKYAEKINKSPNFILGNDKILLMSQKKLHPEAFLENNVSYRMNNNIRKEFIVKVAAGYCNHYNLK